MGNISRMPYEETLKEWTSSYRDNDQYIKMFLVMDRTMKYIHDNGYYIINFNPKNIIVGVTKNGDDYVIFKSLDVMDDDITNNINNNIYNMAFLEVGLLSCTLDNLRPDFLKHNFSQFKIFIPENLVNYYQLILVNGGHTYLDTYVEIKNKREVEVLTKSLEEDNRGRNRGHSKVKATGHYNDFDSNSNVIDFSLPKKKDNDIAAFVTSYALAFVIIASSLLIPIIAFLFGNK